MLLLMALRSMSLGASVSKGSLIIVYSARPEKAIIGEFTAGEIIQGPADVVWNLVKQPGAGVDEESYNYIRGAARVSAVRVENPKRYHKPIQLDSIRRCLGDPVWRPPQRPMRITRK